MRVFAISDLHTDFKENWEYLQKIVHSGYGEDLLIVAGDIADRIEIIEKTLEYLKRYFKYVSYVPGNHEFWVRDKVGDSFDKLVGILNLCKSLDVQTDPKKYGEAWIVPLFSWYETKELSSFIENDEFLPLWADFHLCKWNGELECVGQYFADRNEPAIEGISGDVISFSHFLPTGKLLPDLTKIRFKSLDKVSVCPRLMDQIKKIGSKIHVFGHTHINLDIEIENIRFIQNALRYPRERKNSLGGFKFIKEFDCS